MRKRRRSRSAHGTALSKPHKTGWAGRWRRGELVKLKEAESEVRTRSVKVQRAIEPKRRKKDT